MAPNLLSCVNITALLCGILDELDIDNQYHKLELLL